MAIIAIKYLFMQVNPITQYKAMRAKHAYSVNWSHGGKCKPGCSDSTLQQLNVAGSSKKECQPADVTPPRWCGQGLAYDTSDAETTA